MQEFSVTGLNFCPFIQPIIIALYEKNVRFSVNYVEQGEKPAWLLALSPTGSTPFLTVDDEVLFESAVINEFIDEVTEGSLHPENPFTRARNRVWIDHSYQLLDRLYELKTAADSVTYLSARNRLIEDLETVHAAASNSRFFNGNQFNLIDGAYAPVFRMIQLLDHHYGTELLEEVPGLSRWSASVLSRDSVKASVVKDIDRIMIDRINASDAFLASLND